MAKNPRKYFEKIIADSPYSREDIKRLLIAQGKIKTSTTELSDEEMTKIADGIRLEMDFPEMVGTTFAAPYERVHSLTDKQPPDSQQGQSSLDL